MVEVAGVLITSLATIICAFMSYKSNLATAEIKRDKDKAFAIMDRRVRESMLSLKLLNAVADLSLNTARSYKRNIGKELSEDIDVAMSLVTKAQGEYQAFLEQIAMGEIEKMLH